MYLSLSLLHFPLLSSGLRLDFNHKGHVGDKGCLQLVYFRKWFKEQGLERGLEDEKANHSEGQAELPPSVALREGSRRCPSLIYTDNNFFLLLLLLFKCDSAIKIFLSTFHGYVFRAEGIPLSFNCSIIASCPLTFTDSHDAL